MKGGCVKNKRLSAVCGDARSAMWGCSDGINNWIADKSSVTLAYFRSRSDFGVTNYQFQIFLIYCVHCSMWYSRCWNHLVYCRISLITVFLTTLITPGVLALLGCSRHIPLRSSSCQLLNWSIRLSTIAQFLSRFPYAADNRCTFPP